MHIIRFEGEDNEIHWGCDYKNNETTIVRGDLYSRIIETDKRVTVKTLLSPVAPPAIICIGLNYRLHAKETDLPIPEYPVVFMKNPGAATAHKTDILIPRSCVDPPQVDYEAELGVIIGKPAKNISSEEALDYVFGYTCANDVSARRWQKHAGGNQWVKAKSFDTFCPFGPWIVTADEIKDPQDLGIQCLLNNEIMQKSNTSDMIFTVAQIISYLSQSATLFPGTIILTGTPSGVGFTREPPVFLKPGDVVQTRIEKIGVLENGVSLEE
ncbi:MAG: fumarylacetoacetate hydrolase family protein [Desulfobacteraceae bacterium]|nr:fumarylacetoacetate hydrolase family protein [Desulfobacteraceae bacterium]